MKKIFIKYYKKNKYHIKKYSWKYWLAVVIESTALIVWSIGLHEIFIKNGINPANYCINIGGILFTFGSFLYAKMIEH